MSDYFLPEQVEADADIDVTSAADPVTRHVEVFSGPAFVLRLSRNVDPSTVKVHRDGQPVPVTVDGDEVRRVGGHFGRGRWTVTYQTD